MQYQSVRLGFRGFAIGLSALLPGQVDEREYSTRLQETFGGRMGSVCTKTADQICMAKNRGRGCGFSCSCMTCSSGDRCDCSCRWLVVAGMILFVLSFWIAAISYREKRRWLFTWSSIYTVSSAVLTTITYSKGPDSHEWYGCSVPLSLWSLFLFISVLSYYTTDFMHRGQLESERGERYVYDPKMGEYVRSNTLREFHAI